MQHTCSRKLMGKKGKKYPAHQIARKKFLMTRNHSPLRSRVKWSAPYSNVNILLSTTEISKASESWGFFVSIKLFIPEIPHLTGFFKGSQMLQQKIEYKEQWPVNAVNMLNAERTTNSNPFACDANSVFTRETNAWLGGPKIPHCTEQNSSQMPWLCPEEMRGFGIDWYQDTSLKFRLFFHSLGFFYSFNSPQLIVWFVNCSLIGRPIFLLVTAEQIEKWNKM